MLQRTLRFEYSILLLWSSVAGCWIWEIARCAIVHSGWTNDETRFLQRTAVTVDGTTPQPRFRSWIRIPWFPIQAFVSLEQSKVGGCSVVESARLYILSIDFFFVIFVEAGSENVYPSLSFLHLVRSSLFRAWFCFAFCNLLYVMGGFDTFSHLFWQYKSIFQGPIFQPCSVTEVQSKQQEWTSVATSKTDAHGK